MEGKCFDFTLNDRPVNIIIFIGKNGCGKSTLLKYIFRNLYHLYCKKSQLITQENVEKISLSKEQMFFEENKDGIDYYTYVTYGSRTTNIPAMWQISKSWQQQIWPDIYDSQSTITIRKRFIVGNIMPSTTNIKPTSLIWVPSTTVNDQELNQMRDRFIFIKSSWLTIKNLANNVNDHSFVNKINEKLKETTFYRINERLMKNFQIQLSTDNSIFFNVKKEKNLNHFNFTNLSQGEKQFLHYLFIMDTMQIGGGEIVVFYDELETSLHNEIQKTIVNEIIAMSNNLNTKGIKHQIFISTHSPFILENFLNKKNVVIYDVENNENIRNNKKLLLSTKKEDDIKLFYDEILFHYYHISTTNYFIMLYEKIKNKLKKNNEIINELNKSMGKVAIKIKCIDDKLKEQINKMINEGKVEGKSFEISKDQLTTEQSSLTRFRNLLSHCENEINYQIFKKNKRKKLWNDYEEKFYEKYENDFNFLLREQINIARDLLLKSNKFKDKKIDK